MAGPAFSVVAQSLGDGFEGWSMDEIWAQVQMWTGGTFVGELFTAVIGICIAIWIASMVISLILRVYHSVSGGGYSERPGMSGGPGYMVEDSDEEYNVRRRTGPGSGIMRGGRR